MTIEKKSTIIITQVEKNSTQRREEMFEMRNSKTIKVKMKRIDVVDLMLAVTAIKIDLEREGRTANKWTALYDLLEQQLDEFDKKLDEAEK